MNVHLGLTLLAAWSTRGFRSCHKNEGFCGELVQHAAYLTQQMPPNKRKLPLICDVPSSEDIDAVHSICVLRVRQRHRLGGCHGSGCCF